MNKHLFYRVVSLGVFAISLAISGAQAAWPDDQPIKIIVPQAPGGTNDTVARLVAVELGNNLKQTVIVENKPGAAGAIGIQALIQAKPDGYTLGLASDSAAILNVVRPNLPFNFPGDVIGIGLIGEQPISVAVSARAPYKSLKEVIAAGQKSPGEISYGSSGVGTNQHIVGEWLSKLTNSQFIHIPYKGGGAAISDLVSGQIPFAVLGLAPMLAQQKAGKVNIVAVTSSKRDGSVPNAPTLKELGIPIELVQWNGLVAPAKTPAPIVKRLSDALVKSLASNNLRVQLQEAGMQPKSIAGQEFDAYMQQNSKMWSTLIPALQLKLE